MKLTGAGREPSDREACQAQRWALGSARQNSPGPVGERDLEDAEMSVTGCVTAGTERSWTQRL